MDSVTQTAAVEQVASSLKGIAEALAIIASVLVAAWQAWAANRAKGSLAGLVLAIEAGTSALPPEHQKAAKDKIRATLSERGVYTEVDRVVQAVIHGGESMKPHTQPKIKAPEET